MKLNSNSCIEDDYEENDEPRTKESKNSPSVTQQRQHQIGNYGDQQSEKHENFGKNCYDQTFFHF
jgi:hypothetical protein